uniref:CBM6 domain-containing protein n=1 Tax=Bionectria ochroleuca TaxID=29856 RepID=A0A8H7NCE2_BIOOC
MKPITAAFLLGVVPASQAALQVVPGATWTASNTGRHVQAHGAGIIEDGGKFYMIGEDKTNGSAFQNINCYSSSNLVEWTFENALLTLQSSGDLGPSRVVERPKVIRNASTGKYVMYLHIDSSNYGEAKVGVAVSNTVCGKYEYRGSFQPLGFQSRDMGLFKDDDGSAYLLTEDRANGLRIDALSSDYLSVTRNVYTWSEKIESPAIWKTNGYYFMFGSHLTGWDPNDNVYSYATSLSGPWSSWANFADSGSNTYSSQTSYILPWNATTAIYMGDRWHSTNLKRSTYIWLPLELSGTTSVWLRNRESWVPDVASRRWSAAPSESAYEAEAGTLSNGAVTVSCSGCSGGTAVGYIGGSSGGTLRLSGLSSGATSRATLKVRYANGDSGERYGSVNVNGVSQSIAFLPTSSGQSAGTSAVHVNLNSGSGNTFQITGLNGQYGPDVDRVLIPAS